MNSKRKLVKGVKGLQKMVLEGKDLPKGNGVIPEMRRFIPPPNFNTMGPNIHVINAEELLGDFPEFLKRVGPLEINLGKEKLVSMEDRIKEVEQAWIPMLFGLLGYKTLPKDIKVPKELIDEFSKFVFLNDKANDDPPEKLLKLMQKFLGKKPKNNFMKFPVSSFLFYLHNAAVGLKNTIGILKDHKDVLNLLTILAYEGSKSKLLEQEKKNKLACKAAKLKFYKSIKNLQMEQPLPTRLRKLKKVKKPC